MYSYGDDGGDGVGGDGVLHSIYMYDWSSLTTDCTDVGGGIIHSMCDVSSSSLTDTDYVFNR